jgi:transcriptional regulator with XRE-family HTH domain
VTDPWDAQMEALGAFIRSQRKLANLSLRQLAELSTLSNPYLSQLERGMHQPSVRVLQLISGALDLSAEMLLAQAGLLDPRPPAASSDPSNSGRAGSDPASSDPAGADAPPPESVQAAIEADDRLDDEQKRAILAVYRSMLRPSGPADDSR